LNGRCGPVDIGANAHRFIRQSRFVCSHRYSIEPRTGRRTNSAHTSSVTGRGIDCSRDERIRLARAPGRAARRALRRRERARVVFWRHGGGS
jgi:hypothetical protein